jgi:hypothetical protein
MNPSDGQRAEDSSESEVYYEIDLVRSTKRREATSVCLGSRQQEVPPAAPHRHAPSIETGQCLADERPESSAVERTSTEATWRPWSVSLLRKRHLISVRRISVAPTAMHASSIFSSESSLKEPMLSRRGCDNNKFRRVSTRNVQERQCGEFVLRELQLARTVCGDLHPRPGMPYEHAGIHTRAISNHLAGSTTRTYGERISPLCRPLVVVDNESK